MAAPDGSSFERRVALALTLAVLLPLLLVDTRAAAAPAGALRRAGGAGGGAHAVAFGGAVAVPAAQWDAVQARVDCVARRGAWTEQDDLDFIIRDAAHKDDWCGTSPWSRAEKPSLWYNWSGHGAACGAPVRAFSRARFCAALRGRELLVVGDSMSFLVHNALLAALVPEAQLFRGLEDFAARAAASGYATADHAQWDECPGHVVCAAEEAAAAAAGAAGVGAGVPGRAVPRAPLPRAALLRFARNDALSLEPADALPPGAPTSHDAPSRPWLHLVTNESIVLLNTGAHYRADGEVLPALAATFAAVRARAPRAGIIFRNTPGGHAGGGDDAATRRPAAARQDYFGPDVPAAEQAEIRDRFHWDLFPRQNALVEALVARETCRGCVAGAPRAAGGGIVYLDVDNQTSLRRDRHRDPLHYCIPGPVDNWLTLLQAVLEAPDDVLV